MEPIIVTGIIFAAIYGISKLLIQRKERIMLVDKLGENMDEKGIRLLSEGFSRKSFFSTLTIGFLLLGVGLGFILGFGLVETFIAPKMEFAYAQGSTMRDSFYHLRDTSTIIYFASVFVMGGVSLIAAYLVERKDVRKNKM